MPENPLENLKQHQFIALGTFRKSGAEVVTPVWFVNQDGKLYVWTEKSSGKVKRLKNNPAVHLAPSDFRGAPRGDWLDATATVHALSEMPEVEDLFRKKYGLQFRLFSGLGQRRGEHIYLAIAPKI